MTYVLEESARKQKEQKETYYVVTAKLYYRYVVTAKLYYSRAQSVAALVVFSLD